MGEHAGSSSARKSKRKSVDLQVLKKEFFEKQDEKQEQESRRDQAKILKRGVSLGFLLRFTEYVRKHVGEQFSEMTTSDLVHGIGVDPLPNSKEIDSTPEPYSVRGLTRESASNLVDFFRSRCKEAEELRQELETKLEIREIPEEANALTRENKVPWFGDADFFVSHAWGLKLKDLLEALQDPRCTDSKDIKSHYSKYFWIDIFAVNQHYLEDSRKQAKVERERKEDLENFDKVIQGAKEGVILFLNPWNNPMCNILGRAWCWLEISLAIKFNRPIQLALTRKDVAELRAVSDIFLKKPDDRSRNEEHAADTMKQMLKGIDVRNSDCRLQEDKVRIFAEIDADPGFEKANELITLQIASLLMTTADALLSSHTVTGAENLYEAMLEFFPLQQRVAHQNSLVRVYMLMGWKDKGASLCQNAIKVQRELISKEKSRRARKEIELEMASNLNSLGRLWCDTKRKDALENALLYLDEALKIRGDTDAEVLYNIGRSIVLHWELFGDVSTRNRQADLARARQVLERSQKLQERRSSPQGSLGACYVFVARVLELQGETNKQAIIHLFQAGVDVQKDVFGAEDPRVFLTMTDFGRFNLENGFFDEAYEQLKDAYDGLSRAVKNKNNNPVKLLECIEVLLRLCLADPNRRDEAYNLISSLFGFLDYLETNRPHILDSEDSIELLQQVFKLSFQFSSKFDFVLDYMASQHEERNDRELDAGLCQKEVANARERLEDLCRVLPKKHAPAAVLRMKMEMLMKALPCLSADVIISDAPYNIGIDSRWDSVGHEMFVKQIREWARLMVRCLAPDGIGFAFTDVYYISFWIDALRTARGAAALNETSSSPAPVVLVESVVWHKPDAVWRKEYVQQRGENCAFTPTFRSQPQVVKHSFEVMLIFRRSASASVEFTEIAKTLSQDAANVFAINKCGGDERLAGDEYHPAQKPLKLMNALVEICLRKKGKDPKRDLLVVEPFCGTGSGLVASSTNGIPSIGCDTEQKWIETSNRRLATAKHRATQKSGRFSLIKKFGKKSTQL